MKTKAVEAVDRKEACHVARIAGKDLYCVILTWLNLA